jgi:hypothetical protein
VRLSSVLVTGLVLAAIAAVGIVELAGARTVAIIIAAIAVAAVAVYLVSTNIKLPQNSGKP